MKKEIKTKYHLITSTTNDIVKYSIKLQDSKFRKNERLIFVDGEKSIEGLISDKQEFEYIFLKEDNILKDKIKAKNIVFCDDKVLKKIATVKTPSTIAGIIKEPEIDKNIFKKLNKIALLDGIKDPGNLGTIIRSAVAFSMDGIILFNDCVDLYNTKVIRATAQNIFKLPIIQIYDINFIKELKKNHGLITTVVNSKNDFTKFKFPNSFIIALGSEAKGVSKDIIDISDELLTFFMDNNVESINLGVCASIAFSIIKLNK